MDQLPFRQIHLDFHTSELMPNVGKDWSKQHFQDMLKLGHVNSINVFAKCHHGWCYYPTKVPLSRMHPTLTFDLFGEMLEAAHEIGVKVPAYISAGLDEKIAVDHAHWMRRFPDGTTTWVGWMEAGYHELCMRSPYLDYLVAQTEEVVRNYDVDGVWLDIVGVRNCGCQYCIAELLKRGLDPRSEENRLMLGRETYLNYCRRINEAIKPIKPDILIVHNSGHITRGDREAADLQTHWELESLPTGGWGYDHFPLSARYVQQMGKEFLGMTGKFHTTWGEFGGFKHPNALRYESSLALMNGGKMSVGDQMHPYGTLDEATYALIGQAYAEVEEKEPWCHDVKSIADVGVLSFEAVTGIAHSNGPTTETGMIDSGVIRVLQEGKVLFDVLDQESDFTAYKVIILPDAIPADAALAAKLAAYLNGGGKILATGSSLIDFAKGEFQLDFGAKFLKTGTLNPTYIVPCFKMDWESAAFVMYSNAEEIAATHGEVMADRQDSFFNRDFLHFSSHYHTPNTREIAGPAMVKTANTVYLAYPAFQMYAAKGQAVLREIILQGIRELLPEPTLVTNLQSQGIQTVMHQPRENRTIVHLLYGSPIKRGQGVEVIEDLIPLHDVTVALQVEEAPARVYLAPQEIDLPFRYEDGVMTTTVPEMLCHQMVVII